LNVDAQLVHVLQARVDVAQFPRRHRRVPADIAGFEPQGAVDQPILIRRRAIVGADHLRPELAFSALHIFPSFFRFQDMRIGVDPKHDGNLHLQFCL
jgi:hypothetical protein